MVVDHQPVSCSSVTAMATGANKSRQLLLVSERCSLACSSAAVSRKRLQLLHCSKLVKPTEEQERNAASGVLNTSKCTTAAKLITSDWISSSSSSVRMRRTLIFESSPHQTVSSESHCCVKRTDKTIKNQRMKRSKYKFSNDQNDWRGREITSYFAGKSAPSRNSDHPLAGRKSNAHYSHCGVLLLIDYESITQAPNRQTDK